MKRKIYGVPGQMECKLIITNGHFNAEVHFRGGSIMDKTRRPATYATSRFIEQDIIENSAEFKSGKIVLMYDMDVPDDAEELARKASLAKRAAAPVEKPTTPVTEPEPTPETTVAPTPEPTNVPSVNAEGPEVDTAESQDNGNGGDNVADTDANDGVQTIEVGCKADAVEWLKERYPEKDYNGNNLRATAAFEAACAEAGVCFIIKNA